MSRVDDDAAAPAPGMLRYAVQHAPEHAVITFDVALAGRTIKLDGRSPQNHIRITRSLTLRGLGAGRLTISGGGATRILFVSGAAVRIEGLALAEGLAQGGAGGAGTGSAGGGGGAAGMGGAIFVSNASLTLENVLLANNRAAGGRGGYGGTGLATGEGGGGGGFSGAGGVGTPGKGGDLATTGSPGDGSGGQGGSAAGAGSEGGWAGGGGGGGSVFTEGVAAGGPGGISGFGGGMGGAGGFFDPEGPSVPGRGGAGGAGLGGALFVASGVVRLIDVRFEDNRSVAGAGAAGAADGVAKGGAIFVCSSAFCGDDHDAGATLSGATSFLRSSAADAGSDPHCPGRDDAHVCGRLSAPDPVRFSISAPASVTAGEPFGFIVTALDAQENVVAAYAGRIRFAVAGRSTPSFESPLPRGVGWFSATLKEIGRHTLTVSDVVNDRISGSLTVAVEAPPESR